MQAERPPSTPPNRAAAAVILLIAAVVGFAIGSWFGQATKSSAAASPSPSLTVASASPAPSSVSTATSSSSSPAVTSASPSTSGGRVVLLDQMGTGDFTSDTFTARRGWQIQWQTDAGTFDLQVHGDPDIGRISDHPGPVSGVVSPPQAGTFHVEIKADGPWSVKVLQGP